MIYYTCVIIDKVEKTGLVYSSLPTGCSAGIPGPDETKVIYEEITGSRNKYVCIHYSSLTLAIHVLLPLKIAAS